MVWLIWGFSAANIITFSEKQENWWRNLKGMGNYDNKIKQAESVFFPSTICSDEMEKGSWKRLS